MATRPTNISAQDTRDVCRWGLVVSESIQFPYHATVLQVKGLGPLGVAIPNGGDSIPELRLDAGDWSSYQTCNVHGLAAWCHSAPARRDTPKALVTPERPCPARHQHCLTHRVLAP